jgi:hypothetical protein
MLQEVQDLNSKADRPTKIQKKQLLFSAPIEGKIKMYFVNLEQQILEIYDNFLFTFNQKRFEFLDIESIIIDISEPIP